MGTHGGQLWPIGPVYRVPVSYTHLGALSGQTMEQIEDAFAGKGYGDLKSAVADAVIGELSPIQAEYKRLIADKGQLEALMKEGREKAARVANRTMSKVYRKMGFIGLR